MVKGDVRRCGGACGDVCARGGGRGGERVGRGRARKWVGHPYSGGDGGGG